MKTIAFTVIMVAAVLAAAALSSCVVAPEDTSVWQDVGRFSWPTQTGAAMVYKVEDDREGWDDTLDVVVRESDERRGSARMFKLQTRRRSGKSMPAALYLHYLPTRDTLFTTNNTDFRATYALVTPLEKGHTWNAAFSDQRPDSATVRATIVERYSYWKLEGRVYQNVVAVKYVPTGQGEREEYIRFYAEGVGEILTVHNQYPVSNYQSQAAPLERGRTVLLQSDVAR